MLFNLTGFINPIKLKINEGTASLEYWKIIKEVGEKSCLIQNN